MLNILAVFLGGGIGACLRSLTGICCVNLFKINLPIATFLINIIGCFLIGFLYIIFVEKIHPFVKKQLEKIDTNLSSNNE